MEKNARGGSAPVRPARRINRGLFILNGECRQRYLYVDILLVEASRSYCHVYLKDGTRLTVTSPLSRRWNVNYRGSFSPGYTRAIL